MRPLHGCITGALAKRCFTYLYRHHHHHHLSCWYQLYCIVFIALSVVGTLIRLFICCNVSARFCRIYTCPKCDAIIVLVDPDLLPNGKNKKKYTERKLPPGRYLYFQSHDRLIRHIPFSVGGPIGTEPLSPTVSRYSVPNTC